MSRFAKLFVLMFLQYAVWGAWAPVAQTYLQASQPSGLGISGTQVGYIFFLMPLATIFMPPMIGSLADRYFRADRLLVALHICSAAALWGVSRQSTFASVVFFMGLHAFLYAPTVALSNTVVFANLADAAKHFTPVRVAGTLGWLTSGLLLTLWRVKFNAPPADLFLLASAISVILSVWCLFLPRTSPARSPNNRFAFGSAVKLLKDRNFMVLALVGLVASTQWDFYYQFLGGFLSSPTAASLKAALPESYYDPGFAGLGISLSRLPAFMTLSQVSEVVMMLLLPSLLKHLGMKWTLTLGLAAWPLRYAAFILFPSSLGAVTGLLLHGVCVCCFLIAPFIYVDQVAPEEIRASAQSLMLLTLLGLGRGIGSLLAGLIQQKNVVTLPGRINIPGGTDVAQLVDWQAMFAIPCGVGFACAIVFPIAFQSPKQSKPS